MASVVKGFIEYSGLADGIPPLIHPSCFKQIQLQDSLTLSEETPAIKQIVQVKAEIVIPYKRIVKTPHAVSEEGQILTGKKLIIEGELKQKFEYVAEVYSHPIHAAYFNKPFSTFIVLPKETQIDSPITVTGYIEDISARQLDKQIIFRSISFLIVAEF